MTPAQLDALTDVHIDMHSDKSGKHKARSVSKDPAADLAALAAL